MGSIDLIKWLEIHKPNDVKAHILSALMENGWVDDGLFISARNNHYSHSGTMYQNDISICSEDENDVITKGIFGGASVRNLMEALPDTYVNDISDEVLDDAKSFADDIYRMLRDEYEYLCSKEVIAELCDANEYLFSEDGKHFV